MWYGAPGGGEHVSHVLLCNVGVRLSARQILSWEMKTPKLTETFALAYFGHFAPRSNAAKQRRTSANLTSE
jgi:hypothetical protein